MIGSGRSFSKSNSKLFFEFYKCLSHLWHHAETNRLVEIRLRTLFWIEPTYLVCFSSFINASLILTSCRNVPSGRDLTLHLILNRTYVHLWDPPAPLSPSTHHLSMYYPIFTHPHLSVVINVDSSFLLFTGMRRNLHFDMRICVCVCVWVHLCVFVCACVWVRST